MKRQKGRSNRHRIKSLRNYTIADTSLLLGVHRRTVREWINSGLPVLESTGRTSNTFFRTENSVANKDVSQANCSA